ncbi:MULTISPECIES: hypothetical protein [unclassified Wolbachia]|uniref:hypothetical protein n=1 Tax=unclassified Wolbachia TaxID=2640676 RepID=UPI00222660A9|nr:hypothetical protein [Wolbachia endosymbiont (group A) of Lasioglossum morio]
MALECYYAPWMYNLARLLLRTPEQLKLYCKLLDNEKRQDLYQKVLKEMRRG